MALTIVLERYFEYTEMLGSLMTKLHTSYVYPSISTSAHNTDWPIASFLRSMVTDWKKRSLRSLLLPRSTWWAKLHRWRFVASRSLVPGKAARRYRSETGQTK